MALPRTVAWLVLLCGIIWSVKAAIRQPHGEACIDISLQPNENVTIASLAAELTRSGTGGWVSGEQFPTLEVRGCVRVRAMRMADTSPRRAERLTVMADALDSWLQSSLHGDEGGAATIRIVRGASLLLVGLRLDARLGAPALLAAGGRLELASCWVAHFSGAPPLQVRAAGALRVRASVLERNAPRGAVAADAGTTRIMESLLHANAAAAGGAVRVSGSARAVLRGPPAPPLPVLTGHVSSLPPY